MDTYSTTRVFPPGRLQTAIHQSPTSARPYVYLACLLQTRRTLIFIKLGRRQMELLLLHDFRRRLEMVPSFDWFSTLDQRFVSRLLLLHRMEHKKWKLDAAVVLISERQTLFAIVT